MGCGAGKGTKYEGEAGGAKGGVDETKKAATDFGGVGSSSGKAFLTAVPQFAKLADEELDPIVAALKGRQLEAGDVLFKQGEPGEEFFMVVEGSLELVISGEHPASITLSRGDYFGEKALIHDDVRAGTVTAKATTKILVLSRDAFNELGLRDKVNFSRGGAGNAVQAERIDLFAEADLPTFEKDNETMELIIKAIKEEECLKGVVDLSDDMLTKIAQIAEPCNFASGTEILTHGDTVADNFYIMTKGKVGILVPTGQKGADALAAKKKR